MAAIDGIYQHLEGTQQEVSSSAIKHEIAYATDLDALIYTDNNMGQQIFLKASEHNVSSGIQGGIVNEYYHLTEDEYINVGYLLSPTLPLTISGSSLMINLDSDYFSLVNDNLSIAVVNKTIRYNNNVVISDNYDLVTKGYLDSMIQGATWLPDVNSFYEPLESLPFGPDISDRYISTATGNGWTLNYIYEWNGSIWVETIPSSGNIVSILDPVYDTAYQFTGLTWRSLSAVTLHNSLQSIQGGATSEYYHLSATIYNNIINLNPTIGDIIVGGNGVPFAKISGLTFTDSTLHLPTTIKISNIPVTVDNDNLAILKDVLAFNGTNNVVMVSDITSISCSDSTIIGKAAGNNSTGCISNTIYGKDANSSAINLSSSISVGNYANGDYNLGTYVISIGNFAGYSSSNSSHVINIGRSAGYNSLNASNTINIGWSAGSHNIGTGCINIGKEAGANNSISDKLSITNQYATEIISGDIGSGRRTITFNVAEVKVNQLTTTTQVLSGTTGTFIVDCDLGSYIFIQLVTGLTTIQLNNLKVGSNIQLELRQANTPLNSVVINAYEDAGITIYPIKRKPNNQSILTVTSNAIDLLSISTGKTTGNSSAINIVSANMVTF